MQGESYKIDRDAQGDIKQFLAMEQNGIANLINIVNQDMRDLNLISEGLREMRKLR